MKNFILVKLLRFRDRNSTSKTILPERPQDQDAQALEPNTWKASSVMKKIANQRLPVELMVQIFYEHSRETFSATKDDGYMEVFNYQLPWAISQVCRYWRAIANATPQLWVHIPLLKMSDSSSANKHYIYTLKENIRRTRGYGLHLQINGKDFSFDAGLNHPGLQILCHHSQRWKTLELIDCAGLYFFLTANVKGRIPLLSWVRIHHTIPVHSPRVVGFLAIAPALAVVRLLNTIGHKFHLPSPNMRELHYRTRDGLSTLELQVTMSSSKVLTDLTLSFKGHGHIGTSVYLPYLERLDIDFNGSEHEWFINHITTPSVIRLIIRNGKVTLTSSLRRLLHRSNSACKRPSKLHKLELRTVPHSPGELTSLLLETPNLRWLRCELPHIADLGALARTPTVSDVEGVLTPSLSFAFFEVPRHVDTERLDWLKAMAHKRCNITLLEAKGGRELQRRLECWDESSLSLHLSTLSSCLWSVAPSLNLKKISNVRKDVISSLLHRIESKAENATATDIAISGVHIQLLQIRDISVDTADLELKGLIEHATRILSKWNSIFEEGIKHLRWGYTSKNLLLYISEAHGKAITSGNIDIPGFKEFGWTRDAITPFVGNHKN